MRRFLARLSIHLMLALTLLVGAAHVIGGLSEYPAWTLIRQFECTPQPCWHDIQVGVTPVEEARRILSADTTIRVVEYDPAAFKLCWVWTNDWHNPYVDWDSCYLPTPDSISALQLTYANRPPLRLGDVLPLMGNPLTSDLMCGSAPSGILFSKSMGILVFEQTLVNRVVPELPVSSITYFAPEAIIVSPQKVRRWTGFSGWANVESDCPR